MLAERLRTMLSFVKRTPLHPQWLLGQGQSGLELDSLVCGRTLDVGCADRWLESSIPNGCKYVGLDFPPTGDAMYRSQPDIFADAATLPFRDSSFDTVVLFEVLEHVKHPQNAIREASRVLRSDGKLLLTMPFLYPMHDEPYDYQRYTRHGLEREADKAGLSVEILEPSLGSSETAGLIMNLALAGMAIRSIEQRNPVVLLLPVVALTIPVVNVVSFFVSRIFPSWGALSAGYSLVATKK